MESIDEKQCTTETPRHQESRDREVAGDDLRVAGHKVMTRLSRYLGSIRLGHGSYSETVYARVVPTLQGALLSAPQATELLLLISHQESSSYKCINLIVALCAEPWDVPIRYGSHGVCYHGNMGERPTQPDGRDRVRRRNLRSVSNKSHTLC